MHHERILAVMDADILAARRKLEQLTTARSSYAAAHGLARRPTSAEVEGEGATNSGARTPRGGLMTALLRAMADGAFWHVDDILAAAQRGGCGTTRRSVVAALSRNSGDGDHFERGRRGTYRVKPEVIAQWASKAETV